MSTSKKPATVDVIVPAYNNAAYLKLAVASVQQQSFQDWQMIIINDGSTDETEQYLKTLSDPRISFVTTANDGPSAARNLGISRATAPYVAFLDADDLWLPSKLAKQLALFESNPQLGLVYGHQYMIDEHGKRTEALRAQLRGHVFRRLLVGNRIVGSASMVMVPRAVLTEVGGFLTDFAMGEDWELWLRIARAYPVDFVPEFLVEVRELPASSQRKFARNATQLQSLAAYIVKHYQLRGLDRRRLTSHANLHAGLAYTQAGDFSLSRKLLLQALGANPLVLLRYNKATWQLAARGILHDSWLARARRKGHSNHVS